MSQVARHPMMSGTLVQQIRSGRTFSVCLQDSAACQPSCRVCSHHEYVMVLQVRSGRRSRTRHGGICRAPARWCRRTPYSWPSTPRTCPTSPWSICQVNCCNVELTTVPDNHLEVPVRAVYRAVSRARLVVVVDLFTDGRGCSRSCRHLFLLLTASLSVASSTIASR